MSGRFKPVPEKIKGNLCYVVEDTLTGDWKYVYDCFLWAEKKAKELNENWSPCDTCIFSDMSADYYVCMGCDGRRYKE